MINIIYILLGLGIGAVVVYLLLKPKLETQNKINEDIISKNQIIAETNEKLQKEYNDLNATTQGLIQQIESRKAQITSLDDLVKEKNSRIESDANLLREQLKEDYKLLEKDYQNEYLSTMENFSKEMLGECEAKKLELDDLNIKLNQLHSIVKAATEYNLRQEEEKQKENYYRIVISDIDIREIKKIREIEPYLRDVSPLNKVI